MTYEMKTIKGSKCIWLQNVGYVKAKKIDDFKRGDKIAYNWGEYATVISKKNVSPKFYEVTVSSKGKKYTSRIKKGSYKPYYK